MSAVLGVSAHHHDSAAALIIDGVLVAAIQEERLSRRKNDASLPLRAMRFCLEHAALNANDLDRVVFYENPFSKLEHVLRRHFFQWPLSFGNFSSSMADMLGEKIWVKDHLAQALSIDRKKVEHLSHHRSHAASTYYASGLDDAAVLVVDALGENTCSSIWHGRQDKLYEKAAQRFPNSLGLVYSTLTAFLGFYVNEGEFKVMGLAPFGEDKWREAFSKFLKVDGAGQVEIDATYFNGFRSHKRAFSQKLISLLGQPRPPHRPWNLNDPSDQHYANIAATLQACLEQAMLALAKNARRLTGSRSLCLAGGVALNAKANQRIIDEGGFDEVFVQPAAGDAGGALGAAYIGSLDAGDTLSSAPFDWALGKAIDTQRTLSLANALGLKCRQTQNTAGDLAALIEQNKVVAFVNGRSEWGPRALGGRSIFARADKKEMREKLNRQIKKREPFRPFAPVMLDTNFRALFDLCPDANARHMTSTRTVPKTCDGLQATTHIDQSTRAQALADDKGVVASALHALGAANISAMINTSLNVAGQPLVCSEVDALTFFIESKVDAMIIEDLVFLRHS